MTADKGRLSRRKLFGAAGVGAAVVAAGAGYGLRTVTEPNPENETVDFHGEHQAGIVTDVPDQLHFAAFDVTTTNRDAVIAMLREWTAAAAAMTAGKPAGATGAVGGQPEAPPDDTGEALELPPCRLTLTIGFGPSLFTDAKGTDRFGLASRRPAALAPLPAFAGDNLRPEISGGDIAVQACADDPQVAVHAIRNLARIAFGTAAVRYSQLGFGRSAATSQHQTTPRNLFGFKDGTNNLKSEDAELPANVWVPAADGPDWMIGGSYLVTRRIRMHIETWDRTSRQEQEQIVGRVKGSGSPLGLEKETDPLDFTAVGADGQPIVPTDAHVRLAHPSRHGGARLLRRGYNFVDGSDGLGKLDAGLFFMAYQRDPRRQFVPIQRALATDPMNEYLEHTSSAVFACPPGIATGRFWGDQLFGVAP